MGPVTSAGAPAEFTRPVKSAAPDIPATADRRGPRKALRASLWTAVVFLTVVGISAAAVRMSIVAVTLATPPSERPQLTRADEVTMGFAAAGLRLQPGTGEYSRARAEVVRVADAYTAHPLYTVMHLLPGALILLLAPLQFSRGIRTRHIRFHRWSGRTILLASIAIAISALYFGVLRSTIHPAERPTIAIITAFFLFAASRAYLAIRRRDVARHREWMLRTYAVLIGIASVRVVAFPMPLFFRGSELGIAVMTSWWVGWLLTLSAAELWIHYSRHRGIAQLAVEAP